ncbi:MAG: hypothetical protein BWY66_00216 [bacterium ADurb.Bin374]|nr:MAG: hypothetical protein BWY66_00216 [bacterium ADurb.Bin374]
MCFCCFLYLFIRRRQIHSTSRTLSHNGKKTNTHSSGLALGTNVRKWHRGTRQQTCATFAIHEFFNLGLSSDSNDKSIVFPVDNRFNPNFLAFLRREPEGRHKRHMHVGEGGVGAFDGAGPEPSDDGELFADVGGQVGAVFGHLGRDLHLRIQVADPLFGLLAHPGAVTPHVFGQAGRARPVLFHLLLLLAHRDRPHGGPTGELRRDLDHRLVDQHRDGVQIRGPGFETQPLGFERQSSAAREGIVKRREPLGVEQLGRPGVVFVQLAGLPPALADLFPRLFEHPLVGGVFPQNQVADDPEQPLPLGGRLLFVHAPLEVPLIAGIVDHLGEDDRPRRRQRPPRPPMMNSARMRPNSRHFLVGTCLVNIVERQRNLNQLPRTLDLCHDCRAPCSAGRDIFRSNTDGCADGSLFHGLFRALRAV